MSTAPCNLLRLADIVSDVARISCELAACSSEMAATLVATSSTLLTLVTIDSTSSLAAAMFWKIESKVSNATEIN